MILKGQAILHPTRKEDGTPDQGKIWPMPTDTDLRRAFQSYESDAFAGHPRARNAFYQSTLNIYAAMSSDVGDATGVLNSARFNEAIRMAVGGIEKHNGKATVMPYGFTYGQFKDGLSQRIDQLVSSGNLDDGVSRATLMNLPVEAMGDGSYVLRSGDGIFVDKHKRPVVIDFHQSLPFNTSGGNTLQDAPPTGAELKEARKPMTMADRAPIQRRARATRADLPTIPIADVLKDE